MTTLIIDAAGKISKYTQITDLEINNQNGLATFTDRKTNTKIQVPIQRIIRIENGEGK